jgi:ABC-type multidrug transport system fused ATPase/permease subunit
MVIQSMLSLIDLVSIFVIGLLASLSLRGTSEINPSSPVAKGLNVLGIDGLSFKTQVLSLGFLAIILVLFRTFSSIALSKLILFELSKQVVRLSQTLLKGLTSQNYAKLKTISIHDILFAATTGAEVVMINVIAARITVISETVLLLVLLTGILFVNPLLFLQSIVLFGLVFGLLHFGLQRRISSLGLINAKTRIENNRKITELFDSYREMSIQGRVDFQLNKIHSTQQKLSGVIAENSYLPQISKSILESVVVLGGILIAGIQFFLNDADQAIGALAIFFAAGSRLAPSILRIQQGINSIRTYSGTGDRTLDLLDSLTYRLKAVDSTGPVKDYESFVGSVSVKDLSFTYKDGSEKVLDGVSLEINAGTLVAVIGPSGSGKSTLIDILLGLIPPDEGYVCISGIPSAEAIQSWPGLIGYVPQEISISDSTIRENITRGYNSEDFPEGDLRETIAATGLDGYIGSLTDGLDSIVGEGGAKLSGGQRQRLGLARALITQPKLLVLDEATSSLDQESEAYIGATLDSLRGRTTVVIIAHRMATVKNADLVIYLDKGRVIASGKYKDIEDSIDALKLFAHGES